MSIPDGEPASPHAATDADFAHLYERHYAAVFAFACRRTGDRTRAEDVTAHTFLLALQAYGRYDDRGVPIMAWLLRIAGNVVREQARREWRGPRIIPLSACPPGWDSALRGHPDDWAERLERRAWIAGHLAALAPDARQGVWLRYGEDWAIDDVARAIGRSPGATKQLLHRAIKDLRTRLSADVRTG